MENKLDFWRRHLIWFIPFVSEFYPLDKFQLLQYEDLLDWDRINANLFIWWTQQTKDCFQDRLAAAKPIEEVQLPGENLPISLFYPSYEQVYLREDIKLKSQEIYWKDIEFGVYENLLEDYDDALMELIRRFDCGLTLEEQLHSTMPIPTQFLHDRKNTIDWEILSAYWGLNWSFELLQQFEDYWVTEQLICNHTAFNYCLKDDLDDEFIEKVLS